MDIVGGALTRSRYIVLQTHRANRYHNIKLIPFYLKKIKNEVKLFITKLLMHM